MKNKRLFFIVVMLAAIGTASNFIIGAFAEIKKDTESMVQEKRKSPFIPQFPIIEPVVEKPIKKKMPVISFPKIIEEPEVEVFHVEEYRLQGVVWGAYAPKAIINKRIYKLGDVIDEAEITKINKTGVTVLFNEEEYLIRTNNPFTERGQEGVLDEALKED